MMRAPSCLRGEFSVFFSVPCRYITEKSAELAAAALCAVHGEARLVL